jgi:plasmid stabilization system protein ParE
MRIIWSPEAIEDIASIRDFMAEDNPAVAQRLVVRIIQSVRKTSTSGGA